LSGKKKPTVQNKKHKKKKSKGQGEGHFCKVCGSHKANEKFTGKGHASHICKSCQSLPIARRNEMMVVRRIDSMAFRWLSESEIKWLRKKMNDPRPEVREAAQSSYSIKFPHHDKQGCKPAALKTPVLFSEIDDKKKAEVIEQLEELIEDFFCFTNYLPDDDDKKGILTQLCDEMSEIINYREPEPYDLLSELDPRFDFGPEYSVDEKIAMMHEILEADDEDFDPYEEPDEPEPEPDKELIADDKLKAVFDEITVKIVAELKADGIGLSTFMDSLIINETGRLKIRKLCDSDLDALWKIMSKPVVMHTWGNSFKKKREVKKWINQQYGKYDTDGLGYGYLALILKDTGRLIGQAGLVKTVINGENAVEIGCILDNSLWGQGYAFEAVTALCDMAFGVVFTDFVLGKHLPDRLYTAISPENIAAVKLAEKLGFNKVGECIKTFNDKNLSYDLYMTEADIWKQSRVCREG